MLEGNTHNRLTDLKILFLLFFLFNTVLCHTVVADGIKSINPDRLGKLVIVCDSRLMTIESMARFKLCQYSGEKHLSDMTAMQWFSELLFNQQKSFTHPIFTINNTVMKILGFDSGQKKTFSFMELYPVLYNYLFTAKSKNEFQNNKIVKSEITRLFENVYDFYILSNKYSLPVSGLSGVIYDPNIVESDSNLPGIEKSLTSVFPEMVTNDASVIMQINSQLKLLQSNYQHNDQALFNSGVESIAQVEKKRMGIVLWTKVQIESFYYKINFKNYTVLFFIFSILLHLLYKTCKMKIIVPVVVPFCIGFICFTLLLLLRGMILNRPPVASMYETFNAVAWLSCLIGLIIWMVKRNQEILLVSSGMTLLMIFTGNQFGNEYGTINTVAAILNNNFWLSIHIITIIAGYAAFLGVSLLGHLLLINYCTGKNFIIKVKPENIHVVMVVALVLTTIGTALGGLWADVSWGRFWGWDPKENGALLLILWGTLLLHGYKEKIISQLILWWGAMFCGVMVMCTWIGVNLIGKGMHSYGFTNAGKSVIVSFVLFETGFTMCILIAMLFSINNSLKKQYSSVNVTKVYDKPADNESAL